MLGTEASSSTMNVTTSPTRRGAISARYTAAPMPHGSASSSARPEDTSVPYTYGSAPNFSATGSQAVVVRKFQLNARSDGAAPRAVS